MKAEDGNLIRSAQSSFAPASCLTRRTPRPADATTYPVPPDIFFHVTLLSTDALWERDHGALVRIASEDPQAVPPRRSVHRLRQARGQRLAVSAAPPVCDQSPTRARVQALSAVGTITRTRQLGHVLASVILLRTGRWTIAEWSAELGVQRRTTYRLITTLRRAGIAVEVSREREHERGPATPLYSIPGEPIRKLLRL